jgi:flagellar motor switch protein FliN/FliY
MSESQEVVVADKHNSAFLRDLTTMYDIPLRVGIEVGRLKLSVAEFLRLAEGSVVAIKKPAGEPFEIALNGTIVAKGEVIVVEQSYGVRVVEILKPTGAA